MDVDDKGIARPLVLYIWPHAWSLPSTDPHCIAALLFLQLHFPGKYAVVECADPDLSPSGTLPFLAHYLHTVSSLAEIVTYLSTLDPITLTPTKGTTVDQGLSQREKQDTSAWKAYIDSNLGNLLSLTLYGDLRNYLALTRPALARNMQFPMRFYVPGRIRKEHCAKLERLGWGVAEDEVQGQEQERPGGVGLNPYGFRKAFEGERHLERATPILNDLARLLGTRDYIFHDRPTLLDIYLASYLALLVLPPFPDNNISSFIRASNAKLFTHTHRLLSILPPLDNLPKLPSPHTSVFSPFTRTLKSVPIALPLLRAKATKGEEPEKAMEAMTSQGLFSVGNLLWGGMALAATLTFAVANGWINLTLPAVEIGEELPTETVDILRDSDIVIEEVIIV